MLKTLLMLSLLLIIAGLAIAQPRYTVKPVGQPGFEMGFAINNSGEVTGGPAGARPPGAGSHAFLYDGTTVHDLGPAGLSFSIGYGINSLGHVVGVAEVSAPLEYAFFYDGASMQNLGTLGGWYSAAMGINDADKIAGWSSLSAGSGSHAFFYDGTMHDLGTLGGATSTASGINSTGMIAGDSDVAGGGHHAFFYDGISLHDVGTLGGTVSYAEGINNLGQFTGSSSLAGDVGTHAFLYDGTLRDLGTLGGSYSYGYGINDGGQVVGESATSAGVRHAFFYDGTTMYDLNSLTVGSSVNFDDARAINASGQIVANGIDPVTGGYGPFLLTPIPPPAISQVSASPNVLHPANHRFVNVTIGYTVTSVVPAACSLSVASNEAGSNEWTIIDASHVLLLADRNGSGSGRVYTISINCTNPTATTTVATTVTVSHDQGN